MVIGLYYGEIAKILGARYIFSGVCVFSTLTFKMCC